MIQAYIARAGGIEAVLRTEDALHDAVERRLSIISEAAVKLGEPVEKLEPDIPWRGIRGLGNALRHNYDGLNEAALEAIIKYQLEPLARACERLKVTLAAD